MTCPYDFVGNVNYFSNYIEMDKLENQTSPAVIKALQVTFAYHGIPDMVRSIE